MSREVSAIAVATLGAISGSVAGSFGSVYQLTKGQIKCGYSCSNNQMNIEDIIITDVYYIKCQSHNDNLKLCHSYLVLKDEEYNYYRLELQCDSSNDRKTILLTLHPNEFKYNYKKPIVSNTTLDEILKWVEEKFKNTAFNPLINDCSRFNYLIIDKFSTGQPEHEIYYKKKIIGIYFCTSEIQKAFGIIEHGFVIVETDTENWKFEIGGCGDKVQLNMERYFGSILQKFKAQDIKDFQLNQIIEKSENQWGNQEYNTITNNCFDYCKFVMSQFTNNKKNREKVEDDEKLTMTVGGLTLANVSATGLLGAEIGTIGGPIGIILGGAIGAVVGFFTPVGIKEIVQKK